MKSKIKAVTSFVLLILLFISSFQTVISNGAQSLIKPEANGVTILKSTNAASTNNTIRYFVEITSENAAQHKVQVKMIMSSIGAFSTVDLTVSSSENPEGQWVFVQKCYETRGNRSLRVEQIDSRSWRVYNDYNGEIAVEYDAIMAIPAMNIGEYLSYLGEQGAVIYAHALFLMPSFQGTIAVEFELPSNWKVIADERWEAAGTMNYVFSTSAIDSFVALGPWEVYSETFGGNQTLTVAFCGNTKYVREEYVRNIKICLDYFSVRLGKLSQKSLSVIIAPLPLPRDYMTQQPQICVARNDSSWGFFEGTFWHYWFLNVPLHYASQEAQYKVWWFGESASPFFLSSVYSMIGAQASEVFGFWNFTFNSFSWKENYRVYEHYADTKYDIPVMDYMIKSKEASDTFYYYFMYVKGNVVLHLLNVSIVVSTNGAKDIQDLVRYIYDNYTTKGIAYTNEDVLSAVNAVTGIDFEPFFDAYVYGNENLPILTVGNDYFDDWSTLGGILYPSLPNVGSVVPKYATAPLTIELKKETKHFSIYFHPQDEKMATILLLSAEQSYSAVARIYGGESKYRIKMFLTYDYNEAAKFGYNPPGGLHEGMSGGGPSTENGDELLWLNPGNRSETQITMIKAAHEVGHAFMRQLYPGIYEKNWLSWFSESLATYTEIECWLDHPDMFSPFLIFRDQVQETINSCETGNPPLVELSRLENVSESGVEGITFMCYIADRYGATGLPQLLREYNSTPLLEAIPKAFNASLQSIELEWMNLLKKAAANVSICEEELGRIQEEGVEIDKAIKMKDQNSFFALFSAYTKEELYRTLGLLKPVKPKPPSPFITLKYDDGVADGFYALNSSGYIVSFTPPSMPWIIQNVSIYGNWVGQAHAMELWSQNLTKLWGISYSGVPPSEFGVRWRDIGCQNTTVDGPFYVVFFIDSQPAQISLGYDSSKINEHSGLASRTQGLLAWPQGLALQKDEVNWMIRVVGSNMSRYSIPIKTSGLSGFDASTALYIDGNYAGATLNDKNSYALKDFAVDTTHTIAVKNFVEVDENVRFMCEKNSTTVSSSTAEVIFNYTLEYKSTFNVNDPAGRVVTITVNGENHSGTTPYSYSSWLKNGSPVSFSVDTQLDDYTFKEWRDQNGNVETSPLIASGTIQLTVQYSKISTTSTFPWPLLIVGVVIVGAAVAVIKFAKKPSKKK